MSPESETVNHPRASGMSMLLLYACFLLSGVAALIYQTAWTRQFAIVFGTSELAVATVLAAYMGGLALGAWLAERYLSRIERPVLAYALLEIGIAASALFAVPFLLNLADAGIEALFGGQASPPDSEHATNTLFYLVSAFLALVLPTALMGATLPMLARHAVTRDAQIGARVGSLYAVNTAGAVLGALLAAFLLLPDLGLSHTVWFGASLNAVVFLLAAALAQRLGSNAAPRGYSLDPVKRVFPAMVRRPVFNHFPGPGWVLPLMWMAGAVAFFQEVLWTRMLSHVVGSSIYAFGVMVASFLSGIALGGGVGALLARTRERAAQVLAVALIIAAAAAAVAYLQLERLLPQTAGLLQNMVEIGTLRLPMNALFAGLLLLPMTLCIGMTYPLAVRVLAHDAADAPAASARVYAWNTVGAIVGSLAAGFLLIPALRYEGAIRVAVCASALLGILALWSLASLNRAFAIGASVVALAGCLLFAPRPPLKLLLTSPLNVDSKGRLLYYEVGRSASVVMLSQDGDLALRTNGLPEALMDGHGSVPRFSGENWLSPLAVIARPEARDMLVVGLGGGVAIEGVPPTVQHVDVIELEPRVIDANRAIRTHRRRDPLADLRVHLIVNDARSALRLTNRRYDAIVSQPSHPWTAGASHLYTREFMELAHDHLTPRGVFVQWMNVAFMDEDLLRELTATLLDVYSNVRVYRPDPDTLVFLASDGALDVEQQLAETSLPLRDAPLHYARFGINCTEDLVAALMLDTEGARRLSRGAPLITDDDNRIATSSVYEQGRGMGAETAGRVLAEYDPLQRPDSPIYSSWRRYLSFPYLTRRNGIFLVRDPSLTDRAMHLAQNLGATAEGEYARAFYARMQNQTRRSSELLRLAIDQYPDDRPLRQEYLRDYFDALARDDAPGEVKEVAATLKGLPADLLAAARHAVKGEWRDVAQADARLAEIPWQDTWYPEALELRANLRTLVTGQEEAKRYGEQAIQMIDRVAIMNPTLLLYGMRARAGLSAGRPAVIVESASSYARLATNLVRAGAINAASLRDNGKFLQSMLAAAAKMPGADPTRIADVRAEVAAVMPGS
jgi:spermidine synthase